MAQQNINVGSGELAGDGETVRSAFVKINNNFNEVFNSLGSITESINDLAISNWNTSYSWGNHADAGYISLESLKTVIANSTDFDDFKVRIENL